MVGHSFGPEPKVRGPVEVCDPPTFRGRWSVAGPKHRFAANRLQASGTSAAIWLDQDRPWQLRCSGTQVGLRDPSAAKRRSLGRYVRAGTHPARWPGPFGTSLGPRFASDQVALRLGGAAKARQSSATSNILVRFAHPRGRAASLHHRSQKALLHA